MYKIILHRVYEKKNVPGYKILVERLWPRGIKKEDLSYSWWPKEMAPSTELRKWYNHDKDKFPQFKKKYIEEIKENNLTDKFLETIEKQLKKHNVVFLYSSKEENYNSANVLRQWVMENL